jgi:hypothetical protein
MVKYGLKLNGKKELEKVNGKVLLMEHKEVAEAVAKRFSEADKEKYYVQEVTDWKY